MINLGIKNMDSCCFSDLSTEKSYTLSEYQFPKEMSNEYCSVNETMILKQYCWNGFYCDGSLRVYSLPDCSGHFTQFSISSSPSLIQTIYGSATIHVPVIVNTTMRKLWTAYIPPEHFVPQNKHILEIFATVSCALAIFFPVISASYFAYSYFQQKRSQKLLYAISNALFGVYAALHTWQWYTNSQSHWILQFRDLMFNVSTLLIMYYNSSTLNSIVLHLTEWKKYLYYATLCGIHVMFSGSNYLTIVFSDRNSGYKLLTGYWILFICVLDIFVDVVITGYIVRSDYAYSEEPIMSSLVRLLRDLRFTFLIVIQLITSAIYYVFYCLQVYSYILENDRAFLALEAIAVFVLWLHLASSIFCSIHFVNVISLVLKEKQARQRRPKAKQPELHQAEKDQAPVIDATPSVLESPTKILDTRLIPNHSLMGSPKQ
jgi:hypothetical protein